MNWNKRVRQMHRVPAMVFTATLVLTVAALALQGPVRMSYLPLLPLTVFLFSGLYMFVLPYRAARRNTLEVHSGSSGRPNDHVAIG